MFRGSGEARSKCDSYLGNTLAKSYNSLSELLGPDPLAEAEHDLSIDRALAGLGQWLPKHVDRRKALVVRRFIEEPPFTYWDASTVSQVVASLEEDVDRTAAAFDCTSDYLHVGFDNLHQKSATVELDGLYDHGRARDLLILAHEFLPEYLRLAEHVLGNLLPVVWSVRKKGGVDGRFALKNAIDLLERRGLQAATAGYDDSVRNAIAHGKVRFKGLEIEFGLTHSKRLSSFDFLRLFDDLTRTCVSLGLALQLVWLRQERLLAMVSKPPLSLATRSAAGLVGRSGLSLVGAIESTSTLAGRQLHVALVVDTRSRTQTLLECCRVARELLRQGAKDFDRFLFEIDAGQEVSSLVVVLPRVLDGLLHEDAPVDRISEALPETQLLWWDEPRLRTSLRAWSKILKAGLRKVGREVVSDWHRRGVLRAKGRYHLREMRNLSVGGLPRLELRAHLIYPSDAEDPEVVGAILKELVRRGRRRVIKSRSGFLDKGIPWPKRPQYVFVELFRRDGPSRWMKRDGWMGGNIVAVAERTWRGLEPILVKKPQAEIGKISVQFTMDTEEAAAALQQLSDLSKEIRKQRGLE